jgi:hypothetical protein
MGQHFPTSLGASERQLNIAVGYGVGVGLPLLFVLVFGLPMLWAGHYSSGVKFSALPFVVVGILMWVRQYRPVGLTLTEDKILVKRTVGSLKVANLGNVISVGRSELPPNVSRGVGGGGSQGLHGSWGTFRSEEHGEFRAWLTNSENVVEIQLIDGSYVFVTPDEPEEFIKALAASRRRLGAEIEQRG